MCVGDVNESAADHRRRYGNVAVLAELPDFLACLEVVGTSVPESVHDDLGLSLHGVNRRRAPGGHIVARSAPDLRAGRGFERGQKRIFLDVREEDDHPVVQAPGRIQRRARRDPTHADLARVRIVWPESYISSPAPREAALGHGRWQLPSGLRSLGMRDERLLPWRGGVRRRSRG